MAQATPNGFSWQGSLRDLANIVTVIKRSHLSGRLTLRNTVRIGVIHLYFHDGKLIHIVGAHGDARANLNDLQGWLTASLRFERGVSLNDIPTNQEYEQLFGHVLLQLQRRSVVVRPELPPRSRANDLPYAPAQSQSTFSRIPPMPGAPRTYTTPPAQRPPGFTPGPKRQFPPPTSTHFPGSQRPRPTPPPIPPTPPVPDVQRVTVSEVPSIITPPSRVIESDLIATPDVEELINPWEWQVLVEGTRRISLAVAHLVGPREAVDVLRDILDDCSAGFPALSGLEIAATGYLHVTRTSQLDHISRSELLEGFAALFATCEYFCSPIIGEVEAHKLMMQALNTIGPTLVGLGVFHINQRFLSNS